MIVLLVDIQQIDYTLELALHEPLRTRFVINYNIDDYTKEEGRCNFQTKLKGTDYIQPFLKESAIEENLNGAGGLRV